MEDEWEEEEQLVVVELSGVMNNDLSKLRGTCKILDIDSERPMMQLGQYVLVGEYEDVVGTCVLFEEGPSKGNKNVSPELKYKCHTMKRLVMQRTFLTEKDKETSTASEDNTVQQDDIFDPAGQEENTYEG